MHWFIFHLAALLLGFGLDFLLGDPRWLPHPIRLMGALISLLEKGLRRLFPATPKGELTGGVLLVILTAGVSTGAAVGLLILLGLLSPALAFVGEVILSYQMLAARSLRDESTKVYRALRSINPSPYLFYFDFGGFRIFGSSPETHCKIEAGRATIDPIAGTYRRTGNAEEDRRAAEKLLRDPKESAEHTMLVDLARNDLSRNCEDVQVEFYKEPQFYSHVIHLVSRVSGRLPQGAEPFRVYAGTFPAGTLSGAPKVRAMQLISEIENTSRGAYGGSIGFIGLDGSLNQAITIRSFVSRNGELWYQAGAGIVAGSCPESELQEVNNKLGALKKAIEVAARLKN